MADEGHRIIRLPGGDVRVRARAGLVQARGLRYARARRFAQAEPVTAWDGVLDATVRGAACPQARYRLGWVTGPLMASMTFDEDCLSLTVTAPVPDGKQRPVMVWLHGGGYVTGSGEAPACDPTELVAQEGVVVVTLNYRLGVLGFYAIEGVAPANLGLFDQMLALRWVRDNIAAFGGDPGNVTLFGHSAGAQAGFCLMVADGAQGLFQRTILQSAPLGVPERDETVEQAMREAARAALPRDPAHAPIADVLAAQVAISARAEALGRPGSMVFGPQLGLPPLPAGDQLAARTREAAKHIEVMAGATRDDVRPFFALNPRLAPFIQLPVLGHLLALALTPSMTRRIFQQPADELVRQVRDAGGRAIGYRFDWRARASRLGACHCIELPFLLGTPEAWAAAPMLGASDASTRRRLAHDMRARWARFARSGVGPDDPPFLILGAA